MTEKLIDYMSQRYIETGYMYSGFVTLNRLHEELNLGNTAQTHRLMKEALDSKIIERRECDGTAYQLPLKQRKKLIEENDLAKAWQKKAPHFYPNGEDGEITRVMQGL